MQFLIFEHDANINGVANSTDSAYAKKNGVILLYCLYSVVIHCKFKSSFASFTVVAMEVLIKHCINSFPKLTNSFDRKLINLFQNCSTSLLFVCDWSILAEVKSNWLTGTE